VYALLCTHALTRLTHMCIAGFDGLGDIFGKGITLLDGELVCVRTVFETMHM
jgi:hypothetical protein